MPLKPDFSAGMQHSDATVALALMYGVLKRNNAAVPILSEAIAAVSIPGNETMADARRRLEEMLKQASE